jgi:hypothetical protein
MGEDPWIVWFSRLAATIASQPLTSGDGSGYSRQMIDNVMADAPIKVEG